MKDINIEKLKELYEQGLSDNKIAERLNCSRKTIERRRISLNLPAHDFRALKASDVDLIKQKLSEGISGTELCRSLNISMTTLSKFKKEHGICSQYDKKLSDEDVKAIMYYAQKGVVDTKIASMFGVSRSNIQYIRKTKGIKSLFSYDKISKIKKEKFKELFDKGLSDKQIAKELNVSESGVYGFRKKLGYNRKSLLEASTNPLTQDNIEILLGILMGDASMENPYKNARIKFAHCEKQKDYTKYIADNLSNLNPQLYSHMSFPDKRTGKCYSSYWCTLPANPEFNMLYEHFYKDGKKRIPIELFNNYTWQSLAYHFMDDGWKSKCAGGLATNCFNIEDLEAFQKFLREKFSIETTICKSHVLYIKTHSFNYMKTKIAPYVCDCMKYKIN